VKQKRALLKSNPPRDNGMKRRNENVSTLWGGQKPPRKNFMETFIFEPPHALKNLGLGAGIPRLFGT
jgi:hypothetical protein